MFPKKTIFAPFLGIMTLFFVPPVSKRNREQTTETTENRTPSILFDLNDVLFHINKKKMITHLGFFDTAKYLLSGHSIQTLQDKVLTILHHIDPLSIVEPENNNIPMHNNKPVPKILCDWMQGKISTCEVTDKALATINARAQEGFFTNDREQRLITNVIKIMLDPTIRTAAYKPLKKGIKLARLCKKLGYNVFLLSNMDSEIIPLLEKKYPDIFEIFDGKIISADVNMLKPHKNIYQHTLTTYNLNPLHCYFIDDQPENIQGARSLGIKSVLCDYKRYYKVYDQFYTWNLLPKKRYKKPILFNKKNAE
ncbi:MAG TPA: HAD family hydrolase [Candidatus Babeliales bacterium]|nr:HAD family hydrolase [Candidatus Babeliales bacterium]